VTSELQQMRVGCDCSLIVSSELLIALYRQTQAPYLGVVRTAFGVTFDLSYTPNFLIQDITVLAGSQPLSNQGYLKSTQIQGLGKPFLHWILAPGAR